MIDDEHTSMVRNAALLEVEKIVTMLYNKGAITKPDINDLINVLTTLKQAEPSKPKMQH
jgi:hypothetical protein